MLMKDHVMRPIAPMLAATLFLAGLIAAPARGQEVKAGDLMITQAWSRATPNGAKIGSG